MNQSGGMSDESNSSQNPLEHFIKKPFSNGHPLEQAMIRKWWHEEHKAHGRLVWEYYLEGRYLDAIWFHDGNVSGVEEDGVSAPKRFPLAGKRVTLCESKIKLTPELIGQALVYRQFAIKVRALVQDVYIFSESADSAMFTAASELGLKPVVLKLNSDRMGQLA